MNIDTVKNAMIKKASGNRGDALTDKEDNRELDPMYFGGTPYTDAMRAKYAEIMNNDKWQKFKWRQEQAQKAAEGARFAVDELKQNPLGFRSGSPLRPGAFDGHRPMYNPAYSDKLLKVIWRSAGEPDLWHRNDSAQTTPAAGNIGGAGDYFANRQQNLSRMESFRAAPTPVKPTGLSAIPQAINQAVKSNM